MPQRPTLGDLLGDPSFWLSNMAMIAGMQGPPGMGRLPVVPPDVQRAAELWRLGDFGGLDKLIRSNSKLGIDFLYQVADQVSRASNGVVNPLLKLVGQ